MAYDLYPVDLIENKRRLVARAVAEEWLCVFEHDPQVPWGRIVGGRDGERSVETVAGQDSAKRSET